jgi:hypothetical protein
MNQQHSTSHNHRLATQFSATDSQVRQQTGRQLVFSPFGSQHVCSHSDRSPEGLRPADCATRSNHCHFHCARGFATPVLAHMLDSLVRVSRRGKENHFVNLSQARCRHAVINSHCAIPAGPTKPDTSQDTAPHPQAEGEI